MNKINLSCDVLAKKTSFNHFLLIMRTATILLFTCVFISVAETGYTQSAKVTLNKNKVNLKEVLNEIENQTDYLFIYNDEVNTNKTVSVRTKNGTVSNVLTHVLKDSDIDFMMEGNHIILSYLEAKKKEEEKEIIEAVVQQGKTVTGKVTDTTGESLPGVTVLIKGTSKGTITDVDGNFTLSDVTESGILQFSFVGMQTQEIVIGSQARIDISMADDSIGLEEVVAVGYGIQKKINLTGSISSMDSDQLDKKIATQASQLLQGEMSGITVMEGSGNPGKDGASLVVRGLGTYSGAGTSPLVIIDGFPGDINNVNPNDILSISVLKDAASSSIYGSRAANGVVLINTKRGKESKLKVSIDSYIGKQEPLEFPDYLNSWDYAKAMNVAQKNIGHAPTYSEEDIKKFMSGEDPDNYPNKQHLSDLFDSGNGLQTKHNLTLQGSESNISYMFSAGYLKQNGIVDKNYYDRYDLRLNLNSDLKDNLKFSLNLSGNETKQNEPGNIIESQVFALSHSNGLVRPAMRMNATIPGRKSDGSYGSLENMSYEANMDSKSFAETLNNYFSGTGSLEWNIIGSLKLTGKAGYTFSANHFKIFSPEIDITPTLTIGPSQLQESKSDSRQLLLESLLEYDKTIGGHELYLLGGFSQETYRYSTNWLSRDNFGSDMLYEIDAGSNANMQNSGTSNEWALRALFGRINYSFNGKYLLEGNIRYDGSSRFSRGNRFGLFPSLSAAWRVSEESFFKIKNVDNLKLRASVGTLGNQQIGAYPYQKVLSGGANYQIGGAIQPGVALTSLPTQNITWETTSIINGGFDVTLFNGLINFSVDNYYKKTSDILYNLTVAKLLGMSVGAQNAGEVENYGWEFDLIYKNSIKNFKYSIHPNFSYNKNKVTSLAGVDRDINMGLFLGESLWSIYGYETEGLFLNQEDIDSYAVQNFDTKPGYPRFKDISGPNGEPDGLISANYDRKVIGTMFPKYTYGLSITTDYKGFDFYLQLQGQGGMEKSLPLNRMPFYNSGNIEEWHYKEAWTEDNPNRNAKFPRLEYTFNSPPWDQNLSYWLRNASYLKIKNIQLGYTLPSKIIDKTFLDQVRFYINAQNVYSFDNYYPGWDPEQSLYGGTYYPTLRQLSFGTSVKF